MKFTYILFDHVHNVVFYNHAKFHDSSIIGTKVTDQNVVKNVTSVTLFVCIFTIPSFSFLYLIYSSLCIVQGCTVCVLWYSSYKTI